MWLPAVPLLLAMAAAPPEIPAGSRLLVRMVNSIHTATAQTGDTLYMTTASPVSAGDVIVVPVGAYVQGTVVHVKRAGKVKGRAELAIRLDTITLPRGKVLRFNPKVSAVDSGGTGQRVIKEENTVQQGADQGRDAARVAILAGTGASIGGWVDRSWQGAGIGAGIGSVVGLASTLFTRGKEVELRAGSTMDVVFSRAVPLD